MSYSTQRDALVRTRQDLIVLGVRECQNHYASLVQQLMTYTEEIDNAAWTKTSVTVTANNATAPDGTLTADICVFNADNDAIHQEAAVVVTSKAFTQSIWLRVPSGSATISLRIRNTSNSEGTQQSMTVTTTWTRFWLHRLFTGTPVDNVHSRLVRLPGDTINGDIEVWGWNLHQNPSNLDRVIEFPYVKRVAEAVGTVSVNASRCSIADNGNGSRCYYSRPTCQDVDNFNAGHTWELEPNLIGIREYKFCRQNAPLPLPSEDVAPMVVSVASAAQEIDAERAITVNERMTVEFEDDAGPGVWNPRQQSNGALVNTATGVGTFWRRWVAINRNYSNPEGYMKRKVGFVEAGMTESDFQTRGTFIIRNYEARDRRITITCADRLKLTRKSIPAKISDDNTLMTNINSGATSFAISDAGELPPLSSAYVVTLEIDPDTSDSEKVNVTAIDLDTNIITVDRGRWGTTARSHINNAPFRHVMECGTERTTPSLTALGKNGIDFIIELYRYAGLSAAEIDTAQLQDERDTWLPSSANTTTGEQDGPLFRRTISDVADVESYVTELRELMMLFLWVNDSQQLTGRLYAPIRPSETPTMVTDDSNLVAATIEVDDNDEMRISRAMIAYGLPAGADAAVAEDYNNIRVVIDVDAEEREYYGEARMRIVLSQWLRNGDRQSAEYFTSHLVSRFRHGARVLRAKLEIKDDDIQLGDFIQVNTAHIQDMHGNAINSVMHVVKKKPIDDSTISIEALDTGLFNRYWFYAPDGLPDYDSATDAQKHYGFLSDDNGMVGTPKVPGYSAW